MDAHDLRRAVLARQGLLERSHESVPALLARIAGLQSQYPPTMYIGLWSRLADFARDDLTRALEQRVVVQGTMQRGTIHLVAADDYWPINLAVRTIRRNWSLRFAGSPTDATMRDAARRVRDALAAAGGTLSRRDLLTATGLATTKLDVGFWIDLVRVPPSGTWERRRADLFAAAETWLGPEPAMSLDDAREHLVRHYLTGFGPASISEIATFCGAAASDIDAAARRVATRTLDAEDGTELLDIAGLPLPGEDVDTPPRFLGNWEAILLAHARRSRVLREQDRPRIFSTKMPQSLPTYLVDGQVAGTWRYTEGRIELDEWRPLRGAGRAAVLEEAERLAELFA